MKKAEYITPDILEQNKLLLYLKELVKKENEELFEKMMKNTLFTEGLVNSEVEIGKVTAEDLVRIDLSYLNAKKKNAEIKLVVPEIVAVVDQRIKDTEIIPDLKEAGFPVTRLSSRFANDLKIVKHYSEEFPDEGGPSFIEKLKSVKDLVAQAVKSDTGNVMLSTAVFSIAVATGGVGGIAISGAMYATKLMENKKVQGLMDSLQSKTNKFLVDYGFKSEAVADKEVKLSEKMSSITDSKWFKATKVAAMCCMVGVGSFALTSMVADSGALSNGIEMASKALSEASPSMSDFTQSVNEHIQGVYEQTHSGDAVANGASSPWSNLTAESAGSAIPSGAVPPGVDAASLASTKELLDAASTPIVHSEPVPDVLMNDAKEALDKAALDKAAFSAENTQLSEADPAEADPAAPADPAEADPAAPAAPAEAGAAPVEAAPVEAAPVEAAPVAVAESTDYVAKSGDTLWSMAKEHFTDVSGSAPTDQQIIAMINDLGLENPHDLDVGQEVKFTNDMSSYLGDDNVKVHTAKLPEMPAHTVSAQPDAVVKSVYEVPVVVPDVNVPMSAPSAPSTPGALPYVDPVIIEHRSHINPDIMTVSEACNPSANVQPFGAKSSKEFLESVLRKNDCGLEMS